MENKPGIVVFLQFQHMRGSGRQVSEIEASHNCIVGNPVSKRKKVKKNREAGERAQSITLNLQKPGVVICTVIPMLGR